MRTQQGLGCYKNLFDRAQDGILVATTDGFLLEVNSRAETLIGVPGGKLVGKHIREIHPPEEMELHFNVFSDLTSGKAEQRDVEGSVIRPDGRRVPVHINANRVDWNGKPALMEIFRDITEQRKLQADIRNQIRSTKLLKKVASCANESTTVEQVLRDTLELVGDHYGALAGHVFEVSSRKLRSTRIWLSRDGECFEKFKAETEEFPAPTPLSFIQKVISSGKPEWIFDIASAIQSGAFSRKSVGLNPRARIVVGIPVLIDDDVTHVMELVLPEAQIEPEAADPILKSLGLQAGRAVERHKTRELLHKEHLKAVASAKMAALGEMAAGIAHEINNPLSIIQVNAEVLMSRSEAGRLSPEDLQKLLESISRTAMRIARIIKGLRTLSRDGGSDPFEVVSLRTILEDVLSLCSTRFRANGVDLDVSDVESDLRIECQPTQIAQVLINLLNNSFDSVQTLFAKWIRVDIRDIGENLEIAVTDSGSGIPEELRERIFQPFFTTKEAGRGTGLGLSISSGIVSRHGGRIFVDPVCKNTRFVLLLPKHRDADRTAPDLRNSGTRSPSRA